MNLSYPNSSYDSLVPIDDQISTDHPRGQQHRQVMNRSGHELTRFCQS